MWGTNRHITFKLGLSQTVRSQNIFTFHMLLNVEGLFCSGLRKLQMQFPCRICLRRRARQSCWKGCRPITALQSIWNTRYCANSGHIHMFIGFLDYACWSVLSSTEAFSPSGFTTAYISLTCRFMWQNYTWSFASLLYYVFPNKCITYIILRGYQYYAGGCLIRGQLSF